MGKLWLQRSDGRRIHIPIQEADVNTPDTAILVSNVQAVNRVWSQPIQVAHPTYGTFTIDFSNPNLTGSCNQCGMCCSHLSSGCTGNCGYIPHAQLPIHHCQHLDIFNRNKWGQANNTQCTLYANILDNFKGCVYVPDVILPEWTGCGFSEVG